MNCPACGAENDGDAKFCRSCGTPLSQDRACPVCGAPNPADALYCQNCGTRMDGVCPACGKPVRPGARFCNYCGIPQANATAPAAQPANGPAVFKQPVSCTPAYAAPATAAASVKAKMDTGRALRYAAEACAAAAALAAFVFLFLIGCVYADTDPAVSNNLFYFFGEAFDDVKSALAGTKQYPGYYATSLYISTVYGTVVSALAILATVTLFILTVIRYLRGLLGKTEKRTGKLALATVFSFAAGALLFLSANNGTLIDVTSTANSYQRTVVRIMLNGATIAGICIVAALVIAYAVCSLLATAKQSAQKGGAAHLILGCIGIVLAAVVFALLACGGVQGGWSYSYEAETIYHVTYLNTQESYYQLGFATAFTTAGQLALAVANLIESLRLPEATMETLNFIMGTSIAGFVLMVALGAVMTMMLADLVGSVAERRRPKIGYAIAAFCICAAITVCYALIAGKLLPFTIDASGTTETQSLSMQPQYGIVISAGVFTLLMLGTAVADRIIAVCAERERRPQEPAGSPAVPPCAPQSDTVTETVQETASDVPDAQPPQEENGNS